MSSLALLTNNSSKQELQLQSLRGTLLRMTVNLRFAVVCAIVMPAVVFERTADAQQGRQLFGGGNHCRNRVGAQLHQCCRGRQDECATSFLDTLCYCDEFCDRGDHDDCCPDYWTFCRKQPPIPPQPILSCFYSGRYYNVGQGIKFNCNQCTCRALSPTNTQMVCEDQGCLIRPGVMQDINEGHYGWKATNYSFFWGKTLDHGYQKRLGACKPEDSVLEQNSIRQIMNGETLDVQFDARQKWPGLIQPVRDQQDFPSSWAIATVDLAADRLAIQSNGFEQMQLSVQQLISCVANRMNHCGSGSTDRAWWYLNIFGAVAEQCYPYSSGSTGEKGRCLVSRHQSAETSNCPNGNQGSTVYRAPPAYRVSEHEEEIMMEIKTNGPVQAIMRVKDDFFMYRTGVYRYTKLGNHHDHHHRHPYHAVRIIGWGVDRNQGSPKNYWLCANSWGPNWGENGYFRIVRGQNECDIEMFVVGVWATRNNNGLLSNAVLKK